jgi:hypothetical protein
MIKLFCKKIEQYATLEEHFNKWAADKDVKHIQTNIDNEHIIITAHYNPGLKPELAEKTVASPTVKTEDRLVLLYKLLLQPKGELPGHNDIVAASLSKKSLKQWYRSQLENFYKSNPDTILNSYYILEDVDKYDYHSNIGITSSWVYTSELENFIIKII